MNVRNARRATTLAALLVGLVGLAAAPGVARAQVTETQKQQAKEHHEKARRFYDVGRYNEAIEEYQKVYVLVDDPNMLFNIAQCHRLSDRPEEALRFYRTYLRRSPNAPNRATVDKHVADLERIVEDRKRNPNAAPVPVTPPVVTPAPPTGDPAGTTPPPATTPPVATAPGSSPGAVTPPPAVAEPPPAGMLQQSPNIDQAPSRGGSRVLPYVLLVGGGVLIATAVISGVVGGQKAKDLERLAAGGKAFDPAVERAGKAANTLAVVTGLAGVAAGITGGVLLFIGRGSETTAAPAATVSLFPVAGPELAGAGARVTF